MPIAAAKGKQPAGPIRGFNFQPFKPHFRTYIAMELPDNPVSLFQLFCPISLVQKWVEWTNSWVAYLLAAESSPNARLLAWKATTVEEVYVWLAILIYIGIHTEKRVADYWVASTPGILKPTHPIIKWMTYARFQLIFRYIRIFPPFESTSSSIERMILRVSEWSSHIQEVSAELFVPGTHIAVDECIIRFTGRSKAKVTIPRKPTPTGLKAWVVAQEGYFMRWKFHIPASVARGIVAKKRGEKSELAATQAVVLELVLQLPITSYHVFFDNLFSSPQLLRALRERGIAGTGTARTNRGIYPPFVLAKSQDNNGKLKWKYNELQAIPTPDNLVLYLDTFSCKSLTNLSLSRSTKSHGRITPLCYFLPLFLMALRGRMSSDAGQIQHI